MTLKVVGGRGKKAPYNTVTIRVPEDLVPMIESFSDQYKEAIINGEENPFKNVPRNAQIVRYIKEAGQVTFEIDNFGDVTVDLFFRVNSIE